MNAGKPFLALGLINLVIWSFKVTNHFFDYHLADEIGLLTSGLLPYLISRNFRGSKQLPFWSVVLVIVSISGLLHPLISFSLQRTDYAWVIPNVLFVALGILLGNVQMVNSKTAPILIAGGLVWIIPFQFINDQDLYFDRLVESTATRQGKIHKVHWKGEEWVHYNGRLTAATIDAHLYYEPLIHPAMSLPGKKNELLLVGGDNGLALEEILKYSPQKIEVVPFDVEFFKRSHGFKGTIISEDPFVWLNGNQVQYDAIFVDLPDPIDIATNQYYTLEFYELCLKHLRTGGVLVTQASSPYFHPKTHYSIKATVEAAGFEVVNYHNQVPTIGQWGWVIASSGGWDLENQLKNVRTDVNTRWWNQEAMQMMLSFGEKGYFDQSAPAINTIKSPLFLSKP